MFSTSLFQFYKTKGFKDEDLVDGLEMYLHFVNFSTPDNEQ